MQRRKREAQGFADGFENHVTLALQNQERRKSLSVLEQIRVAASQNQGWIMKDVDKSYSNLRNYVTQIELLDPRYQLERLTARNHLVRFLRAEQFYLEMVIREAGGQSEARKLETTVSAKQISNALGAVIVSTEYFRRASGGQNPSPQLRSPQPEADSIKMDARKYEILQRNRMVSAVKIPDFFVLVGPDLELVVESVMSCGGYVSKDPNQP